MTSLGRSFSKENVLQMQTYPITILQDRYGGVYSGGAWLAIARSNEYVSHPTMLDESTTRLGYVREITHGDDCTAAEFICPEWVGLGSTPDEALENLYEKMQ